MIGLGGAQYCKPIILGPTKCRRDRQPRTSPGGSATARVICNAAGTLLPAGILAYAPWDDRRHPGDWLTAALPALPGDAFTQVAGLVFLMATDGIDDTDGSTVPDYPRGIDIFEFDGRTYAAVAALGDHGVQILNIAEGKPIAQDGELTRLRPQPNNRPKMPTRPEHSIIPEEWCSRRESTETDA